MKLTFAAALVSLATTVAPPALAATPVPASAPPQGQEAREVKSLSPEQIDAYLSGKGMGLARAAELNGYPGPAHVLELAAQLGLTPEQRSRTEAIHSTMHSQAISLGVDLVEAERKLDRLFATKSVTKEALAAVLGEIAGLQAKLRQAHLQAHLAQAEVLTQQQAARYAQLRGHSGAPASAASATGSHKH